MKIELKPFQVTAARRLWEEVDDARVEIARRSKPQAIVLSSPTGSGKTVTLTALMEWIYEGHESFPADREAVFLWLSDSPELNAQSRDKIIRQSSVFAEPDLVIVEPPFSQEFFEPGKIYFLNTQKLGKDSLLTKRGDGRGYTIWDTVQNTAAAKPHHFYLVIDEAHRGMTEKEHDRAATLVQRFIKGQAEVGLQPVKLIIGMSATPERFTKLTEGSGRTLRQVEIPPEEVKTSGLLKDRIVLYYPNEKQPADLSLLEAAVRRWLEFGMRWAEYSAEQTMTRTVEPVLVIQVEDGNDKVLTRTNLNEVVTVVERASGGHLPEGAWAHAFQEDKEIEAGGRKIRKLDASQIETDPLVKIVLFKMSLTTGWDCPRAEVMMSFRRAADHTLIAQLVGRMVRTPLARTIEGQDFLNSVWLFLPHYDEAGLQNILKRLGQPDPETGPMVEVEEAAKLVTVSRDSQKAALFKALADLPTYRVERVDKTSEVRRLIKLGRQLTTDGIDEDAWAEAKQLVVKMLQSELKRLSKQAGFVGNLAANQEIEAREVWVEYGEWKQLDNAKTVKLKATPENIDDLFAQAGRMLGEGLHMTFWKEHADDEDPYRAKLELYGVLQDEGAWKKLEKVCGERVAELLRKHGAAIRELPSSQQEEYNYLKRIAKQPESQNLFLPPTLEVKKEQPDWDKHLYVDKRGKFGAKLNTWEAAVLQAELPKKEVVGWLRNMPRKSWALGVPYEMGGETKACFPDLIVFRAEKKKIVVDLLDPHDSGLPDAVDKAKGLAKYAQKHGDQFGRIELIVQDDDSKLKRLNVNDETTREKVLKVTSKPHLEQLFEDLG